MNMNAYGEHTKNSLNMFACNKWRPFELQEIYVCLGIVLCSGITNCAGGGYQNWFVLSQGSVKVKKGRAYLVYPKQELSHWDIHYTSL